jgi:hypothetical protein
MPTRSNEADGRRFTNDLEVVDVRGKVVTPDRSDTRYSHDTLALISESFNPRVASPPYCEKVCSNEFDSAVSISEYKPPPAGSMRVRRFESDELRSALSFIFM